MRADAKYDNDHRTSEEVIRAYRHSLDTDAPDISLAVVHYRGGESEFALGAAYARSSDSLDREAGAHVLSQLGWGDNCYLEESVFILLPMLGDPDLLEYLADQKARLPSEDEGFKSDFDSAILACSEIKTRPNQVPEDTARKLADLQH